MTSQVAFNWVLTNIHPTARASSQVHPASVGHKNLAQDFLQALGYSW